MSEPLFKSIPSELAKALGVLMSENIGDMTYQVRERELKGWEGPRVVRFGEACTVIARYAAPAEQIPVTPEEEEHQKLIAQKDALEARIREIEARP
jgi:hypothetical protein